MSLKYYIFIALGVLLSHQPSIAHAGMTVHAEEEGVSLRFDIDNKGLTKIYGLAHPGEYLYHPGKGVLYFTFPNEEHSYLIASNFRDKPFNAKTNISKPEVILKHLGYDASAWRISMQEKDCATIYATPKVSETVKLTLTDISRINLLLANLYGQETQPSCRYYHVPKATGMRIGFPLLSTSRDGKFIVKKIKGNPAVAFYDVPQNVKPLDDKTHARFLEDLLDVRIKSAFDRTNKLLKETPDTYLQAVKRLLQVGQ